MSVAPRIVEGTWEEVLARASEFAGHRLKVIVLDENQSENDTPKVESTSEWLRRWAYNRSALPIVDDSRDTLYGDDGR